MTDKTHPEPVEGSSGSLSAESDAKAPIKGAVPEGESEPDADTKPEELTGAAPDVGSAETEAAEDRARGIGQRSSRSAVPARR